MNAITSAIRTPWQRTLAAPPPSAPAHAPIDSVALTAAPAETAPSGMRRVGALVSGLVSLFGAFAALPASAQTAATASTSQAAAARTAFGSSTHASQDPPVEITAQDQPARPPSDTTRTVDPRTARTDAFLRQWGDGLFDTRLPIGERLGRATAPPTDQPVRYPYVTGNPSGAPALSTLNGIHSFDELKTRVDAQNPNADFGQVALDMGARYGQSNYTSGVGGSVPLQTNAFDLFNKQGGVCVEIHSAIAAYRASHGQEAYVVGSSSTGNAHAYTIFKQDGRWFVQNYGKVVQTDARNIRELFDRALPDEVRPLLYKPGADGKLELVGQNLVTGSGLGERRFSDRAGSGVFDPFVESGRGVTAHGSTITMFGERAHLGVDAATGEVNAGYLYHRDTDGDHASIAGFAARIQPQVGGADVKWEGEKRHLDESSFGRTRLSVFGGVQTHGPSPQYWDDAPTRSIGRVGASVDHNEATLHGQGALRLETGYDLRARAVWTYGLDAATRQAAVNSQNGEAGPYLGDLTRMLGDASASAGVNAGVHYRPDETLLVRGGVRLAENAANAVSTNVGQALVAGFEASAYAEAQWRPGSGLVAGGAAEVPLKDAASYKVAGMVGWSPSTSVTVAAGYSREKFLNETWDRARAGISWSPSARVDLNVGVDASPRNPRDIRGDAGVRVHF